ncbi:4800_t:CDS:2 [Funneliformis geosporum]|uniref:4800_t:CDS:1 n=1 Tax=Funneliformis geosporum TaxID=1117311 RepID=A0A9W4SIY5_9GLOM|nr:4800_t:CDS:2 [Funneliformis geosporum]
MGTLERPFSSIPSYSQNDSHLSKSQQSSAPTFYESRNDQGLFGHPHIYPPTYPPNRVRISIDTKSMINSGLGSDDSSGTKRVNKTHVPSACVNCKRAHLACDDSNSLPPRHQLHQPNQHRHQPSYDAKSPKIISPPTQPRPIQRPQPIIHSQEHSPIITMFLTVDNVACARVSEECLGIMGYYPLELLHQSLYRYVHAQDIERVQKMISLLYEDANRFCQASQYSSSNNNPVTTKDSRFSQISPEHLQYPAISGPINDVSDMIHMRQRIGQYDLYDVRMWFGGGLGADLARKETWNELYIVGRFTRVKLGTCLTNEGSNYVQPRNSVVGGFSTSNSSQSNIPIDPELLNMHHNHNGSSGSSLGVGRSGLISPVLSPRIPEIVSPPLYNDYNYNHKKLRPIHPHNLYDHYSQDHRSQDHRNVSETFAPTYSRTNQTIPRHEHLYSPSSSMSIYSPSGSQSSSSFERRSSAFNTSDSFPKFQNDERVKDVIVSSIPRASSSRASTVREECTSTRMSVNSLLC